MKNAAGMGTICKIKSKKLRKPYIVKAPAYTENGKVIRKTLGYTRTKKEAYLLLIEYHKNNLDIKYVNITLNDMFNAWIKSEHAQSLTQETLKKYINDFKKIFSPLLNKNLNELKYIDYQAELKKYPMYKGKTAITVLNFIYIEAIKLKLVNSNISNLLKSSNFKTRNVKRVIFSDEFVRQIWKEYKKENSKLLGIIIILFYTGMRTKDLLNIKNNNIFIEKKYLITGSKTIAGKNRKIPLHDKIIPIIKSFKNDDEYLFNYKTRYQLIKKFERYLKKINCEGNLHSIRHTFITKMQHLKISVSKVKNIVGHKDNNITDGVYTHWSIDDLLEAINKLKY